MENNKETLKLTNSLLGDVKIGMNNAGYELSWYLDLQKEETTLISETGAADIPEEVQEMVENDDGSRFIPIPGTTSREGWEQMKRFILSLEGVDDETKSLLFDSIQGKGAFRRFKDTLHDFGMIDRWYEYKGRDDRKKALEWLFSENLITENQIDKGMQMYEESLRKRKQREMEMRNMTKGRSVRCTQIVGHVNKLTEGQVYEILAEQEGHPNIRLEDDNGEKQWYPKSHFELYKG